MIENKRDIEERAKALLDSSPEEAVELYRKLFDEFNDECNSWDAFFTIKASRSIKKPDLKFCTNIAKKFNEDEKVAGIYGWLIFDHCVKGLPPNQIIKNEIWLKNLHEITTQKNLRENTDYPCPITISTFQMVDAFADKQFNAGKVNSWLNRLNPDFLSLAPDTISTKDRGNIEIASDFEKYYALKTKALIKLNEFQECKELCEVALSEIINFHYNNDTWFKMRIAICNEKLGNFEESEKLFKNLLSTRVGSDKWFLYRDIAELYFEQENFEKAWQFAVDASFYGNEPHYMIGLFLLQARILFKLGRHDEGKILAQLIGAILKEQDWSSKKGYKRLLQFYEINVESLESSKNYLQLSRNFWISERYKDQFPLQGKIIDTHRNGKIGRIKSNSGEILNFHKKDFTEKQRNIATLKGATVEFFEMESFDGKPTAENITILKIPKKPEHKNLQGEILTGRIKNIVDFGIFVEFKGKSDGLLHISKLPENVKDKFKNTFSKGQKIQVKVERVTEKGLELNYL